MCTVIQKANWPRVQTETVRLVKGNANRTGAKYQHCPSSCAPPQRALTQAGASGVSHPRVLGVVQVWDVLVADRRVLVRPPVRARDGCSDASKKATEIHAAGTTGPSRGDVERRISSLPVPGSPTASGRCGDAHKEPAFTADITHRAPIGALGCQPFSSAPRVRAEKLSPQSGTLR